MPRRYSPSATARASLYSSADPEWVAGAIHREQRRRGTVDGDGHGRVGQAPCGLPEQVGHGRPPDFGIIRSAGLFVPGAHGPRPAKANQGGPGGVQDLGADA
jgi:hypothetical protein